MNKIDIYSLTYDEFKDQLKADFGKGEYHAKALYRSIYKKGLRSFESLIELKKSGSFADDFKEVLIFPEMEIAKESKTEVTKFVTRLGDSTQIESVIIPAGKRTTLCVSSQVGCKMGCSFCRTGDMGFTRNLTTAEIVGQVLLAQNVFKTKINNIVFMGMGEPLDNLENVIQAIKIITGQHGIDIPYSKITVSTSGVADGIRELTRRGLTQIRLAISLNGAEDRLRKEIMPITKKFPIEDLKQALREYPLKNKEIFFIEYVVLKGVNDSAEDAKRVIEFCSGLSVVVNLIPYNGEKYHRPSDEDLDFFKQILAGEGLFVSIRTSRGDDILAACGQLATE